MTNKNDSLKTVALDGALVATAAMIGAIAIAMNEVGAACALAAVAAWNSLSLVKTIRESGNEPAPPAITEETVRMLIARETAALKGLTTVRGFVEDPTVVEPSRSVDVVTRPATYDVGSGFVVFKARPLQSATGSDLMDLEEALRSLDTASGTTLVLTEFRSRRADSATLAAQIEKGGRVNELICHGIFSNVDVIPHLGEDAWKKARQINDFLASVKGIYSRVVIWLPEEEYFAWTGVTDHFGNATTRLFNESVR